MNFEPYPRAKKPTVVVEDFEHPPTGVTVETDPTTGSVWADKDGISWAQRGMFVVVKGHQTLEAALGYVLATQPFVGRMYGVLVVAWMQGAWDSRLQSYHKFGVLRTLAKFEFHEQTLDSPWVQQPWFVEVNEGTAHVVHSYQVADRVEAYRRML